MRRFHHKSPFSIGKITHKKVDSSLASYQYPQQQKFTNSSALLSDIATDYRLKPHQSQIQFPCNSRKPSLICDLSDESDKPLPQVRVSFSKIYELRKVCQKNPEEETKKHYNGLFNSRQSHKKQLRFKQANRVGSFYSPRAKQKSQIGMICHQKGRKSRVGLLGCLSSPQTIKQKKSKSILRLLDASKVKIINQSRAYDFNESTQLPSRQINQQIQSRIIPLDPVCNGSDVLLNTTIQVHLKDQGESKGYIKATQVECQGQNSQVLRVLWEQNYIQSPPEQLQQKTFFLEDLHLKQNILNINFEISFSQMKILLIESTNKLRASFQFPGHLLNTISDSISQPEVHQYAETIFKYINKSVCTQIISFKRYGNCILVTTKVPKGERQKCKASKLAILWYFTGRFYIGGWSEDIGSSTEGYKSGMGLEYYPSNYIYYGSYAKNIRNGFGIMKKSTKEIYLGQWKSDRRHGWGKVFNFAGDMVYDGNFECGTFISDRIRKR